MGWFGESSAHKQHRYQTASNEQLQQYNLENMEIQQGYNVQNMATQFGYENQLMDKQFQYNMQAFNAENAYNSPSAQRQRMAQAGLNPNWSDSAAIGQMDSAVSPVAPAGGSPSGGAYGSASPPSANPAQDMVALGSAYQDIMESRSRMALNEAQQKKTEAETAGQLEENQLQYGEGYRRHGLSSDIDLKSSQTTLNEFNQAYVWEQQKYLTDAKEHLINKLKSEWDLNTAKANQLYETLDPILKEYAARINNLNSQSNYYDVQSKYVPYEAHSRRMEAESSVMDSFSRKMDAETNRFLSSSQSVVNEALSGKYRAEEQIAMVDKKLKDIMYETEKYAADAGLTKYERYYQAKLVRKEYRKACAQIAEILSSTDKNKATKQYLINQIILGWLDSATDVFSPFMPGAGVKVGSSVLHKLF